MKITHSKERATLMKSEFLSPLRLERLKRGWSQYHVAYGSGVPQTLISYGERGYPALNRRHKIKISRFFGVEISDIFPEESNNSSKQKNEMEVKDE